MARTWLRRLRQQFVGGARGPRPAPRKPASARLAIESLEARELLSATPGLIIDPHPGSPSPPPPQPAIVHEWGTALSVTQWQVNVPYSGTIANFGDPQAVLLPAVLPPGLRATKSGTTLTLSGTPTQGGTFPISLETRLGNVLYEGDYSLTLRYGLGVSPGTLPADTAGQSYNAVLSATGGSGHCTFALATGSLPAGLALSAGGVLSGTPTVAGSYSITVQATDTANPSTTGIQPYTLTVNPAAASALVFASMPSTVSAGARFSATVRAVDAYGNGVAGILVTLGSPVQPTPGGFPHTPVGHTVPDQQVRTDASGNAIFSVVAQTNAGTHTLAASAPGLRGATSRPYTVTALGPSQLLVMPATLAATAGNGFAVTLLARDQYGNTCDVSDSVTLTSSDGQLAPTAVTFSHGMASPTIELDRAAQVSLTATSGWITPSNQLIAGSSDTIVVNPAAPHTITFLPQPQSSITAGMPFGVTVRVQDRFGNNENNLPVSLTISSGTLLGTVQGTTPNDVADNNAPGAGQVVFNGLSDTTAHVDDVLTAWAGDISAPSNKFTITAGTVTSVGITSSAPTPRAGDLFTVTITATDQWGNGYTGPTTLTFSNGDHIGLQLTNGSIAKMIYRTVARSETLTAAVGQVSASTGITVQCGPVTAVTVSPSVTQLMAGTGIPVTITAQDHWQNGYTGPVTFTTSDGVSQSVPLSGGTGTTRVIFHIAHTVTLTATVQGVSGSAHVTVTPLPAGSASAFNYTYHLVAQGYAPSRQDPSQEVLTDFATMDVTLTEPSDLQAGVDINALVTNWWEPELRMNADPQGAWTKLVNDTSISDYLNVVVQLVSKTPA